MADPKKVWVLLRERRGQSAVPHAVYENRDDLVARIGRIAERNSRYPMRQITENSWTVGPDEDEGFFGNKPIDLYAVQASWWPAVPGAEEDQ